MKHIGHSLLIFVWNVSQSMRQDSKFKEWLQSIINASSNTTTSCEKISILMVGTHEDVVGKDVDVERKWIEMIKYCATITEELGGQLIITPRDSSRASTAKCKFIIEIVGIVGMSFVTHKFLSLLTSKISNKIIFKRYNVQDLCATHASKLKAAQTILLRANDENKLGWGIDFLKLILKVASHQINEHDKQGFNGKIPKNYAQILSKMQFVGKEIQLLSSVEQYSVEQCTGTDKQTLLRSLVYLHSIGIIYYLPNFTLISSSMFITY